MIPEQTYPELGALINGLPQLFKHSEVVGIFLGNEICASLMHNTYQLDKVVLYENFIDIPDPQHQENLKEIYQNWENSVPNLTVSLIDGINFDTTADYIHQDMHMAFSNFVMSYKDVLTDALLSSSCFGNTIYATTEYIDCIRDKLIFPVMIYRDMVFFTFNEEKTNRLLELIPPCLIEKELYFDYDRMHDGKYVIRLHTMGITQGLATGSYTNKLNEKFTAT
jgi:hypothetical protein